MRTDICIETEASLNEHLLAVALTEGYTTWLDETLPEGSVETLSTGSEEHPAFVSVTCEVYDWKEADKLEKALEECYERGFRKIGREAEVEAI